jgi:uncharacterized protein YfaS (alpha-2-macroglobulin family)
MPLLYFNDLADLAGLPKDQALHARIQDSVDNVLDMQNFAGNFGMWGPGSDADPWIRSSRSISSIRRRTRAMSCRTRRCARRGLAAHDGDVDSNDDQVRAYSFYVLARMGQVNLSDLRYFSDTRGSEWNNAIAAALDGRRCRAGRRPLARGLCLRRARAILMAPSR